MGSNVERIVRFSTTKLLCIIFACHTNRGRLFRNDRIMLVGPICEYRSLSDRFNTHLHFFALAVMSNELLLRSQDNYGVQ